MVVMMMCVCEGGIQYSLFALLCYRRKPALSAEAKNVRFLKIDVDDNQELAVKNRVRVSSAHVPIICEEGKVAAVVASVYGTGFVVAHCVGCRRLVLWQAVPTFIVHDKGQKLEEFTGADEFALRSAVSKLTGAGTSAPE